MWGAITSAAIVLSPLLGFLLTLLLMLVVSWLFVRSTSLAVDNLFRVAPVRIGGALFPGAAATQRPASAEPGVLPRRKLRTACLLRGYSGGGSGNEHSINAATPELCVKIGNLRLTPRAASSLEFEAAVMRGVIVVFAVAFVQQRSWSRVGFECDLSDTAAWLRP